MEAKPRHAEVVRGELTALFGPEESVAERWFLTLWAVLHGAASMAVERVPSHLITDEERFERAEA